MSDYRKETRLHNQHLEAISSAEWDMKQGLYVVNQLEASLDRDLKITATLRDVSTGKTSNEKAIEDIMQVMEWKK